MILQLEELNFVSIGSHSDKGKKDWSNQIGYVNVFF